MTSHPGLAKDEVSGLERLKLQGANGSTAELLLYGGHVTSWKNEKGEELLYLSKKAIFKPPKAIRGGIPICFPQFGPGVLDQHGFARNRTWTLDPTSDNSNAAAADLILVPSADDLKLWPHSFELRMRVSLGASGELTSSLRVSNVDTKPLSFTCALHTYFSVSDISEVRIEGLETLDYLDNLNKQERVTDQGDSITFDSEFDRIYLGTPSKISIIDHLSKKTIVVKKEGLVDAVVWNPWEKKAKAMADLGDEDYKEFVCVEAAVVETPITIKPSEEWRAAQELSIVSSS